MGARPRAPAALIAPIVCSCGSRSTASSRSASRSASPWASPTPTGCSSPTPLRSSPRQLVSEKGAIGSPLTVDRHDKGLPRPYYPFITEITEVGTYGLVATVDGVEVNTKFSIVEPSAVPIPQPGDQMVPVATPTVADAQGVNPICTREPACDLHQLALTDALKQGKPVAFLVATPAYCQTAACGPVLDVLLGQESEFGDRVQMVHAEVYTDSSLANTTQAVHDYRLSFEPVLYLAGADGVIHTRLDSIFDETELHEALNALVS